MYRVGILLLITMIIPVIPTLNPDSISTSGSSEWWMGTNIVIHENGSISPSNAPIMVDGSVYKFTKNIRLDVAIFVAKDDIVLDGNGYTLYTGDSVWGCIHLYDNVKTIKIRNLYFKNSSYILYNNEPLNYLEFTNNRVLDTNLVIDAWKARIENNIFMRRTVDWSIHIDFAPYMTMNYNRFYNTGIEIGVRAHFYQIQFIGNQVNSKELLLMAGKFNVEVRNREVGQLIILESANIDVEKINIAGTAVAIEVIRSLNVLLSDLNLTDNSQGIKVVGSRNVTIRDSWIANNLYIGVSAHDLTQGDTKDVKIFNNNIQNTDTGIMLSCSSADIVNNTVKNNTYGIVFYGGRILVESNILTDNEYAIINYYGTGGIIRRNTLNGNVYAINVYDSSGLRIDSNHLIAPRDKEAFPGWMMISHSFNIHIVNNEFIRSSLDIVESRELVVKNNTVNGKKLLYLDSGKDLTIDGRNIGEMIIIASRNIVINYLYFNDTVSPLIVDASKNITIEKSLLTNNTYSLIVKNSKEIKISKIEFTDNTVGIKIYGSTSATYIFNSVFSRNDIAVILDHCSGNTIVLNNFTMNDKAIFYTTISDSILYGNNFINNHVEVEREIGGSASNVSMDNGYPFGGNYWSGYSGDDNHSGEAQDEDGSDGIGDQPYSAGGLTDRYPLMSPTRIEFYEALVNGDITYNDGEKKIAFSWMACIENGRGTWKLILRVPELSASRLEVLTVDNVSRSFHGTLKLPFNRVGEHNITLYMELMSPDNTLVADKVIEATINIPGNEETVTTTTTTQTTSTTKTSTTYTETPEENTPTGTGISTTSNPPTPTTNIPSQSIEPTIPNWILFITIGLALALIIMAYLYVASRKRTV